LNNFIKSHPGNNLSLISEFNIAQLYMIKEEYGKSRIQLNSIIKKFKSSAAICSEAVFLIGNSYEKEDKWDMALNQYELIMKEYPLTAKGFDMPIYITRYYNLKHQPEKMVEAFQDAIVYYKALAKKYPDSKVSFNAHFMVVQCYSTLKDWPNAVASLNIIIEKYKGKVPLDGVLMSLSVIYMDGLNQRDKAVATLKEMLKDYPKSRMVGVAKEMLKKAGEK